MSTFFRRWPESGVQFSRGLECRLVNPSFAQRPRVITTNGLGLLKSGAPAAVSVRRGRVLGLESVMALSNVVCTQQARRSRSGAQRSVAWPPCEHRIGNGRAVSSRMTLPWNSLGTITADGVLWIVLLNSKTADCALRPAVRWSYRPWPLDVSGSLLIAILSLNSHYLR